MYEEEEWRAIDDLPNYQVSNLGRVRRQGHSEPRKLGINGKGCPVVVLFRENDPTRYFRQVNKLVAQAFLEPPRFKDQNSVWHIDGNFGNCQAINLRWETRGRVLEWNEMQRATRPRFRTPQIKNNLTGRIYPDSLACALAEGELESTIIWRIERQAPHDESDDAQFARFRYIRSH